MAKAKKSNSKFLRYCFASGACSASGKGKSRKVSINNEKLTSSAKKKTGESISNIPKTFGLNLTKMKNVKLPKEIKKKGIDSNEYKKWIWDNWH